MAMLLHGLYDFSIMTLDGYLKFAIPVIIIIMLAFLVFSGFEKLKKMKGVCKIDSLNFSPDGGALAWNL